MNLYHEVSLNYLQYFKRYAPDKSVTDSMTDKQQLYALPSGSIKRKNTCNKLDSLSHKTTNRCPYI